MWKKQKVAHRSHERCTQCAPTGVGAQARMYIRGMRAEETPMTTSTLWERRHRQRDSSSVTSGHTCDCAERHAWGRMDRSSGHGVGGRVGLGTVRDLRLFLPNLMICRESQPWPLARPVLYSHLEGFFFISPRSCNSALVC